jgi:hypothetical protein
MPILGIVDSAKTGNLNLPTGYYQIATQTAGGGGLSAFDFTTIPNTYTHLELRGTTRDSRAVMYSGTYTQFNGDTAANYSWHDINAGNGATMYTQIGVNSNQIITDNTLGNASGIDANFVSPYIMRIYNYTSTTEPTIIQAQWGYDTNGAGAYPGFANYASGSWFKNTTGVYEVVNRIRLVGNGNFLQNSTLALYGVV